MSRFRALLVAPFWTAARHVGRLRVDRMRRWLASAGVETLLLRGGDRDEVVEGEVGWEIAVVDPLGVFAQGPARRKDPGAGRPLPGLWRLLDDLRHNPDPGVHWARRAIEDRRVIQEAAGVGLVISTSPPESAHVAGSELARRLGAAHVADLRDGWLDEPLKPVLQRIPLRRLVEGALERRVLESAAVVLVTSDAWREALCRRLPGLASRTHVLTNAYPRDYASLRHHGWRGDGPLELVHSGTFTLSSNARRLDLLLEPLLRGASAADTHARIRLVGSLQPREMQILEAYRTRFERLDWELVAQSPVPRPELLERLRGAQGLLLLSISRGAIPSKLFEYLPTALPILAVCPFASAVWRLGDELPQLFRVDTGRSESWAETVTGFVRACADGAWDAPVPERFSEAELSRRFLEVVMPLLRDPASG